MAFTSYSTNLTATALNNGTMNSTSKFLTQGALTASNGFLSREERVKQFGVDCNDDITWRIWNVGGEYERRFLIKNTHDKRQIISYKLPKQKATFFVEFPEPATISSGMSYTLVVRFRPLELVEHHDELEVLVKGRGSFKIRLDAYTPYAHLTTPEKFDFNMCPVNVSSQHTFQIKNTGTVPLQFEWEIPAPFSLQPSRGSLLEGQHMDVTVSFTPTQALACVGQAICRLVETGDIIALTNFSGIGKFAFIRIKDCPDGIVDFGDVLTSASEVKYLSLVNPSFVDTDFDLRLTNPDITSAFSIAPMKGTVPRGGETRLAIKFNPKHSGAHYNSDYSVNSVSCATIAKFRCSGCAVGPRVHLSATSVDFGDVDIERIYRDPTNPVSGGAVVLVETGQRNTAAKNQVAGIPNKSEKPTTVDKWVTVNNDSDLPIRFHFAGCDPGCAFKVTPTSGFLKAKSSSNVKITFTPTSPINHLRRLFVMTTGGEAALILDVFGTGFTSKIRPAPFNAKAVQLFFSKLEYGLGGMTPEEGERLIAAMNSGEPPVSELQEEAQQAFCAALDEINFPKKRRAGFATVFPKSVGQHTFPFTIDTAQLSVRHENLGQTQTVVVRNTTSSKATAFWSIPDGANVVTTIAVNTDGSPSSPTNSSEQQFWSVEPQTQDIPANGTATFRITCAANAPPQTFGTYLECYVNYKTMRSFRLVNEDVFTPPHCLLVQCTHLAPYRENGPVPAVKIPTSVAFQPCRDERSVYQVLELFNEGDTAIAYDMQVEASMVPDANNREYFSSAESGAVDENGDVVAADPEDDLLSNKRQKLLADVFQIYPSAGILPAKSSFMVLAKFSPSIPSKFYGALHVSYNGAPTATGNILVKGEGFVPRVELDCDGLLAFRPTTVGGHTTRQYTITNLSRIPLAFKALIPEAFADIVQLSPAASILKGSEKLRITATFMPDAARAYDFNFPVEVSVPQELDQPLSTAALTTLKAEGTIQSGKKGTGEGGKKNSVVSAAGALPSLAEGAAVMPLSSTFYTPMLLAPDTPTVQMCRCKAEGHAAFLSLEPLSTKLGDVGVGGPTHFPLTIYNTGLSDVSFQLRYRLVSCEQDVLPCSPLLVGNKPNVTSVDDELSGSLVPATTTATNVLANGEDPLVVIDNGRLITFGPSATGTIRARSHHTVSVSTRLTQRGKHTLLVYIVCGGDQSLLSATDVDPSEETLARLPQCAVTANGQNASLQITDTRCVYQQKSQLWRQMNIGKVNAVLTEEVCRKDEQMRALSFDDTLSALTPIPCNLGVDTFHAAPIRVHVALSNPSSTAVSFRFRFPIDNEIPKEPWHADQRGLDDPIANVVDRGLFDISPRTGTVGPNGQTIVTFTYFHSEVGKHELPVILRVEDGKQVLLQLAATTIEPTAKYLLFHHEMTHDLIPVAIGDLEPPIQYTEVQNLSATSVTYTIDESALAALKDANYDFPVLQCLNPRGVIPPMSTLLISWFFRPLEVKDYTATVTVYVEGGDSYQLTLNGKGFHPKQLTKKEIAAIYETMFPMPLVPTLEHPSLPIRLSCDVLKFGLIPFHSYHRRHVSLTNNHPDDTFLFEWRSVLQHGDQIFEIEPPRGSIEPGVTVHFCISLYSGSFSHIIDTPVHCHVMNESLRLRRQERIAEREEQRRLEMDQRPEQAATEFAATANSSSSAAAALRSTRTLADALSGKGLRPRHRHAITTVPPKYQSTVRLQKTIQKLEETALAEEVDENAEEWAHVEVTPTVIELLIQTRIMPLGHYTDVYGEDSAGVFFFPTMLGNMHPMKPGYFLGNGDKKNKKTNSNGNMSSSAAISTRQQSSLRHQLQQQSLAGGGAGNNQPMPPRPESMLSDTDASLSQILAKRAENGASSSSGLLDVTSFERDIATGCLREILRRIVQAEGILDTLNDPSEDPVPYFCEMIAATTLDRFGPDAAMTKGSNNHSAPRSSSPIADFIVDQEDLDDDDAEEGNEHDFANAADATLVGGLSRASHDVSTPTPTDGAATASTTFAGDIPRQRASIAPSTFGAVGPAPPATAAASASAATPLPPLNPSVNEAKNAMSDSATTTPAAHNGADASHSRTSLIAVPPSSAPSAAASSAANRPTTPSRSAGGDGTASPTPIPQRTKRSTAPVPGDVQCVVEEVLGDVIFYLMSQALTKEGVVTQASEVARKQRRASEARLHEHASSSAMLLMGSSVTE